MKIRGYISAAVAVIFLIVFIFVPFGFIQINAGEVAVVKVWGEAKEVISEGLHFRNVITTKYEIYNIKTQQLDITNPVYTKDAQPCDTSLVVQYRINAKDTLKITKEFGSMDVHQAAVFKVAREKTEVVLSSYKAMELIENRGQLSPLIKAEMQGFKIDYVKDAEGNITDAVIANDITKEGLETRYYISIENVALIDLSFSDAFEAAVEQKMVEQQAVEKAKAEKEKAIIAAEKDLEVAKLAAAQALAKAQGEADAQVALAKAEAESLKVKTIEVARMLGFEIKEIEKEDGIDYYIDYEGKSDEEIRLISEYLKYIAYLEAWNGELPNVIMDGSGSIIIPMP